MLQTRGAKPRPKVVRDAGLNVMSQVKHNLHGKFPEGKEYGGNAGNMQRRPLKKIMGRRTEISVPKEIEIQNVELTVTVN